MASSTHNREHIFHTVTSAPPPTPATTITTTSNDSTSIDLLSRLLHRLPPNLSNAPTLLRRRSSLSTTTSPPLIPYTNLNPSLPSAFKLGFFQLTNHPIPSKLAHLAKLDSQAICNLSQNQKQQHFPRNWPLGFENDIEEDDNKSLFLDLSCSTNDLSINSLREFTKEMEKVGLHVMEAITSTLGLHNPTSANVCSLMWISDGSGEPFEKMIGSGQFYPYVIGLHYQISSEKCSLLSDSGWLSVQTQQDSILVTLGDIAQVWSNGKLKKIRGRPIVNVDKENDTTLSMSLLVTLPLASNVSTLLPKVVSNNGNNDDHDNHDQDDYDKLEEEVLFDSFSFEDYAWRVYHERVPLKDPLDRYRT